MSKNYRYGSTFEEAFDALGITYNKAIHRVVIRPLLQEGYNQNNICWVIMARQEKLKKYVGQHRFWGILMNEVRIHAFTEKELHCIL